MESLPEEELSDLLDLSDGLLNQFEKFEELDEPTLPEEFPNRGSFHKPTLLEDPYKMFITICLVKGAEDVLSRE
jgi:hypothetical protein